MNRKNGSGTGLFLMEMILAVFFFIISATTCILAFAKSDNMSRRAKELNQAVSVAESVVEVWKAKGLDGLETYLAHGGSINVQPGAMTVSFDENWQVIPDGGAGGQAAFTAEIHVEEAGDGMEEASVTMSRVGALDPNGSEIFSLQVKRYERP